MTLYESCFKTWNFDRENELNYTFQSVISLHLDIFEELPCALSLKVFFVVLTVQVNAFLSEEKD